MFLRMLEIPVSDAASWRSNRRSMSAARRFASVFVLAVEALQSHGPPASHTRRYQVSRFRWTEATTRSSSPLRPVRGLRGPVRVSASLGPARSQPVFPGPDVGNASTLGGLTPPRAKAQTIAGSERKGPPTSRHGNRPASAR